MNEAEAYMEAASTMEDPMLRDFVLGLLQLLAEEDCFDDASNLLLRTAEVSLVLQECSCGESMS